MEVSKELTDLLFDTPMHLARDLQESANSKKTGNDSVLTGAAGEHLVLSRLLSRGFLAAQAPRGTRKADILVNFLDGGTPFLIQVKARLKGADGGWHMKRKHETEVAADLFYCLVDFEPMQPDVYVLPSELVARVITLDHATWLATPGRNNAVHKDSDMRRLRPRSLGMPDNWLDAWKERWDLISSNMSPANS